jgi:hypothetical protein
MGKGQVGGPLNPGSIAPISNRLAKWIGMPARVANQVSGHSTAEKINAARSGMERAARVSGWDPDTG